MKNDPAQMATPGQIKELCTLGVQAIPTRNLTYPQAYFLTGRGKSGFIDHVRGYVENPGGTYRDVKRAVVQCEAFTKKAFGIEVDLAEMFDIPAYPEWAELLMAFIPANATLKDCLQAMKKAGDGLLRIVGDEKVSYSLDQASKENRLFLVRAVDEPDITNKASEDFHYKEKYPENNPKFMEQDVYMIALGTLYDATGKILGENSDRSTMFLRSNTTTSYRVATGRWNNHPENKYVAFETEASHDSFNVGIRLVMEVPLA